MNPVITILRGISLENDLRRLLEEEIFFDTIIKCSDNNTLGANKIILAVRSNVFYDIITNQINNQTFTNLEFNNINSTAMRIVLEYLYTSTILEGILDNVENLIELFYAANYFELTALRTKICDATKVLIEFNDEGLAKKLLSQFVVKFPSLETQNEMSQLLIESVAKIHLDPYLEYDPLSLMGLRYLLCKTLSAEIPFATHEIDLFRYVTTKGDPSKNDDKNSLLLSLIPYIDLRRIEPDTVLKHIEPLNLFPQDRINDRYRLMAQEYEINLRSIRGIPIFRWKGMNITKDGFTLEARKDFEKYAHATTNLNIKGKGIYKWSFSIETLNKTCYIGICENVQLRETDDYCGMVLGSNGYVYHEKTSKWYNAKFKENDVVTVNLNMTEKTCEFLINGSTTGVIAEWRIPPVVYPCVSLKKGTKELLTTSENTVSPSSNSS
ncbi:14952_t:CDS:2 [Funneliformis geosporum]|uniref:7167_t:CDS:1 n=1 Tax=Funneliformis geosporum TaxID=1117311 RepID=A0A9W4WX16_9GLOM|nr:14952_t:CDS:2 [Funneliformis geosporum]CAI2185414.1 7167_t:CDS:2 [Funneliformis geosporum]